MAFITDLRYAARTLRKRPGFTVVAVVTLALGLAAATAMFSVVRGVLLEPLPYPRSDRIVQLWQVGDDGAEMQWSEPNLRDVRAESRTLAAVGAYAPSEITVTGAGDAARVRGAHVSPDFFRALGVEPARGRRLLPEDFRDGAAVAVVSDGYWRTALGVDEGVLGRTLRLDGEPYTIIGVLPPDLAFPVGTDLWVPTPADPGASRTSHNWHAVARLAPGVTGAQAGQELRAIAHRLKQRYGDETWMSDAAAVPLHEELVGAVRPALLVLLAGSGLLLLIACANVANLLLARATTDRREMAVRLALGAGRGRLLSQILSQATLLALTGGALGVLLALWGVGALVAVAPDRLPRLEAVSVDWHVLAFTFAVSLAAAVGIGLVAALRAMRAEVRDFLVDGERAGVGGATGRLRGALVAVQVALTLVLLVGGGLLARSFIRLITVDPGYRTRGAVVMGLTLPMPEGKSGDPLVVASPNRRGAAMLNAMETRLAARPGVTAVGGINALPLTGGGANGMFLVLERPDEVRSFQDWDRASKLPGRTGSADYRLVTPGYFRAMGIPLLRGRLFDDRDGPGAPNAALVSASLAEAQWPGESPIGKLIQFGNMDGDLHPFTVVGVVGDVRARSLEAAPAPTLYADALQRTTRLGGGFTLVFAGTAPPSVVIPAARNIALEIAPDGPVAFRTLGDVYAASLAERRFGLLLLGVLGVLALVLAMLGIYGVVSYVVTQRTREIGIRMALGAQRKGVLRLMVRQALGLTGLGLAAGLAVSATGTRLLASQLYGVGTLDPITFATVPLALVLAALAASYLPARRATAVDPLTALRQN